MAILTHWGWVRAVGVRDLLTFVEVSVTLVPCVTVRVIIATTYMAILTHWGWVRAVGVRGTSCATLVSCTLILFESIIIRTIETVFICIHITDGIISVTLTVDLTDWLASVILTVISIETVSICSAATSVGVLVTNRCGVLTIESTVVTTFTTSIV